MHGPSLAASLAAAVWLGLAPADAPPAPADSPAAAIVRARALIARDDPKGAVDVLQATLPGAGADLGPMIVVLRQAYTRAADRAAKAGRTDEAEELREDLQILNRKMRARPDEPRPTPGPSPVAEPMPRPTKVDEPPPPRGEVGFDDGPPPKPLDPSPSPVPMPTPAPVGQPSPEPLATPAPVGGALSDPLSIDAPSSAPLPEPAREPSRPRPEPKRVAAAPARVDDAVSRAGTSVESPMPAGLGNRTFGPADDAAAGVARRRSVPAGASIVPPPTDPLSLTTPGPDAGVVSVPARPGAVAGPSPAELLKAADTAYLKGLYLDANAHYAALAKAGQLPEARKIHWAYCRSVEVVRRLKAKPASADDWAAIDREIAEIKALSPKYWYAEYLRNRAADMARGTAKPQAPKGRVVRGQMPDSEADSGARAARMRDLSKPVPAVPPMPPVGRLGKPGAFAMAVPSTDTPPVVTSNGESGRWQVKETANFLVFHADPALAEGVARAAEAARDAMIRRWTGSPPPRAWEPKCEVYVYPSAAIFAQVTGQPIESPGFSTMESNGVAVSGRRIKLRADAANLVAAVVPHEVTHVLLADLFPVQQIPRWADEGISVLSEPAAEQEKRVAALDAALDGGRIFAVENLMVSDYPEGKFWPLYFAQSVSLTRFLVDQGKPGQFIDFLQGSQQRGIEPELRRVYGIEGFADLQSRWLASARESSAARVAARQGETKVR